MIKASPRLGALLAGGAALVAFGLTGQATAEPGGANGQCGGANPGAYCGPAQRPHRVDGAESGNGKGEGNAWGKPAAGSVGNADHKNPPGQLPYPDDNNGYECDGNEGIGMTNPAHTGCDNGDYHQPAPGDPNNT
jgi:hypothetical protein